MILRREQALGGLADAIGVGWTQRCLFVEGQIVRRDLAVFFVGTHNEDAGGTAERDQAAEDV